EIRLRDILKEGKRHDQDTEYRETLLKLLSFQQLKRDLLLGSIQRNRADLVDTLSSQGLTYTEIKQRLVDSDTLRKGTTNGNEQAYTATSSKKGKKPAKTNNPSSSSSASSTTKECNWCKKHYPGRQLGHSWQECFKLKKHNEEKGKKKDEKKDIKEEAHATTGEDNVSSHPFYLDSACTSHMTPFADRITNFQVRSGFVRSSSNHLMEIKGAGDLVMDTVLRDGSVSSFRVHVLFVPDLPHPLISWRKLAKSGYSLFATGEYMK